MFPISTLSTVFDKGQTDFRLITGGKQRNKNKILPILTHVLGRCMLNYIPQLSS